MHASVIADEDIRPRHVGPHHRDRQIALKAGKTVDDPVQKKILDNLGPGRQGPPGPDPPLDPLQGAPVLKNMADADKQHAFMSIQLKGDNDDAIPNNYNKNVGEDGKTVKEAPNTSTSTSPGRPAAAGQRADRHHR